jgi:glycosyltransferase EpsD
VSESKRKPAAAGEAVHDAAADPPRKKILFTASTMSHIENFHLPYLKAFEEMGWEVKALALPVSKSFFSFQNIRAIFSTRKLLLSEGFDVVSSQSTLAGIITRLAVLLAGKSIKPRESGKSLGPDNSGVSGKPSPPDNGNKPSKWMKVFHTSHGYLFHDGNSLKKWAYLLPEILCGKVTDVLMVMNHEDLAIAKKYKLCGKSDKIYYINGMGIDLAKFEAGKAAPQPLINEWKKSFGLKENDFAFVYAAEFSKRKNHQLLLRGFAQALSILKEAEKNSTPPERPAERLESRSSESLSPKDRPSENLSSEHLSPDNLKLVLAGDGALLEETKALAAELGIDGHVLFPGYVRNIPELYACCQASVTTSRIEGLPFNVMEAMACGLPVVASNIKGHHELIAHGENGLLFESENQEQLTEQLVEVYKNAALREKYGAAAIIKVKEFSVGKVFPDIMSIYHQSMA